MIRHIVFFKFKPGVTSSQRQDVLNELRSLPGKIDVIRSYEVGEDIVRSARAWDAALIAVYDDLEALKVYSDHPAHLAVVSKIREVAEAVGSVDYEF